MSNLPSILLDSYGRKAAYLRISVTDRCNLGCFYCVNGKRQKYIPHEHILRYEEIHRLIKIGQTLGIKKVRITGGEPFARLDLMKFLVKLRADFPDLQLAITTNATLIEPWLEDLAALKLKSINISLDSFDAATFQRITGSALLERVIANTQALLSLGVRVKINAVAIAGYTDTRLSDFIHFARNNPVDVRFIEYMPMGGNTLWDSSSFMSSSDLRSLICAYSGLTPVNDNDSLGGPAKMYEISGARGRIGFISAVSDHFCASCNRMRITSAGNLRPCLFGDTEIRLAQLLRNPAIKDRHIAIALLNGMIKKPQGADLFVAKSSLAVANGQMVGIGG